jgi:hypothetical protein
MDDLQMLADTLAAPEMSREAVDSGRHRLENRMCGPVVRRRRSRMPALIAGLTAAGMATAAVVAASTGSTGPAANPNSPPSADSGRQILLAAAITAERQPATSGRYWHLKLVDHYKKPTSKPSRQVTEYWVGHDGQRWYRAGGQVVEDKVADDTGYQVAFTKMTVDQLQGLPVTSAGLTAWINNSIKHSKSGTVPQGTESTYVPRVLIDLLYEDPTPPNVRAAAYRALAALPNVKSAGAVKGGRRLVVNGGTADEYRLVFDPKTSVVRSVSWGDRASHNNLTVLVAEWTNILPK